jgi:hypothetical protein
MNYPLEILPNEKYKLIDCNIGDHFLVRLILSHDLDEIYNADTEQINVKSIFSPVEGVEDLSFSLWGVYNQNHISLRFTLLGKDKYMHYCKPDASVECPQYEQEFTNDGAKYYWSAPVSVDSDHVDPAFRDVDPPE